MSLDQHTQSPLPWRRRPAQHVPWSDTYPTGPLPLDEQAAAEADRVQRTFAAARESGAVVRDYADEVARIPRQRNAGGAWTLVLAVLLVLVCAGVAALLAHTS